MCLAVPARVISIQGEMAKVEIAGVHHEASIMLTPQVRVGDYIVMHAGFAIQVVDAKEAEETLRLIEEIVESEPGTVVIGPGSTLDTGGESRPTSRE
ncbi:MAG: HypC/HybG/HupF family hydrogenase formation chaperone [candidate division WOR-3 bacterium]